MDRKNYRQLFNMSETDHIIAPYVSDHPQLYGPVNETTSNNVEIKVSGRRFFVLFVYCVGMFYGAFTFIQYTVIADQMTAYYGVSSMMINLTSIVFTVGFILGMPPTIWLFETKGLKFGLVVGLALNAMGTAFKCIGLNPDMFWAVLLGQSFLALGQCFFLTTSPYVASVWFADDEISRATASGVFVNSLGVAVAAVLSPYVVTGGAMGTIKTQLGYLMYSEMGVSLVAMFLAIFFVDKEPPHPPSMSQAMLSRIETLIEKDKCRTNIKGNMIKIFRNKDFLLLAVTFGMSYAVIFSFATVFNQMLLGLYPGANKDVGFMVLLLQLTALLGTAFAGTLLDKTHKYKIISIVGYLLGIASIALFTWVLYTKLVYVYIAVGFVGFFVGGFLTVGLDLGAQMTYPISEVSSLGVAGIIGNIVTLLLMFSCGILLDSYGALATNLLLLSASVLGFICLIFAKIELHRLSASLLSS